MISNLDVEGPPKVLKGRILIDVNFFLRENEREWARYREKGKERESPKGHRKRERERKGKSVESEVGLELMKCEIMTWAKLDA